DLPRLPLAEFADLRSIAGECKTLEELLLEHTVPGCEQMPVQCKDLRYRRRRWQQLILGHITDALLHSDRLLRRCKSEGSHGTRVREEQSHCDVDQCRLASAVAPQQADYVVLLHRERHPLQYR